MNWFIKYYLSTIFIYETGTEKEMGDDAISTTQVVSQPPQSVVIETPRLIISDFTPEDLEPIKGIFKNLHSSGQTWFNADINRPNTIRSFLQMILDNQKDTPRDTYRLAIRRKDEDGRIRLIGYVSMCEIFSDDVGKPDTGVLIDPQLQKSGYAREARIAQNFFGFGLGIKKLACCIKPSNIPSINNVLGMGYSRVMLKDNSPLVVKTDTIRGVEDCHIFIITREHFLGIASHLVEKLANRYWSGDYSRKPFVITNFPSSGKGSRQNILPSPLVVVDS